MAFLRTLDISGSALTAQKLRMKVIAQNLANASTTKTESGEAYKRKLVVFKEKSDVNSFENELGSSLAGVEVSAIVEDNDDYKLDYDPQNPNADENGYIKIPNVNTLEEMIDMMSASRSYEANITAFNAIKQMASAALNIGK
ncbi:MAG: flagellar basal body rod protein FlgC [Oscillospiraceae bacterium]|nr:flagellar basal body rod protein FlgC [Oscillospiraceae bacterium]